MLVVGRFHMSREISLRMSFSMDVAVNTASRMESNSLPGKIQVSETTADLLRAANKGSWLLLREGGIEAKGKGRLVTYWIHPEIAADTPSMRSSPYTTSSTSASVPSQSDIA